jgi:probable rRNA maturation factor
MTARSGRVPARIHVHIDAPFRQAGRIALVRRAARAAAAAARADAGDAELTVVLSDDSRLRDLNARFRGANRPTDVLSFAGLEAPGGSAPRYLGDLVISMDRCAAQARAQGHGLDAELALLVIHGTLHLLGHDHDTSARKADMWAVQGGALRSMGFRAIPTEI